MWKVTERANERAYFLDTSSPRPHKDIRSCFRSPPALGWNRVFFPFLVCIKDSRLVSILSLWIRTRHQMGCLHVYSLWWGLSIRQLCPAISWFSLVSTQTRNNPTHKREADLSYLISPLLHCGSPLALNSSDDDDL